METKLQNHRPKYLNLLKISLPLPGVVSILHRIAGVLLFFPGIPVFLCLLQMMLGSEESFNELAVILVSPFVKIVLLLFVWFFLHHLCAGIRYLALDLHYGTSLLQARATSKLVLISGLLLTILFGIVIW